MVVHKIFYFHFQDRLYTNPANTRVFLIQIHAHILYAGVFVFLFNHRTIDLIEPRPASVSTLPGIGIYWKSPTKHKSAMHATPGKSKRLKWQKLQDVT